MSKPIRCNIAGKVHQLVVMRVESRDENGLPEHLSFLPDDRVAELSTNPEENHFICAWVSIAALVPHLPPSGGKEGGAS